MIIKDDFYIGYRDVDTNLKIKNSAILNLFEDIAGMHANIAGENLNGVFSANDVVAMGFMKCMMNKEIKIPDQIKVMGFDNVRISSMYQPGISTIMLPVNEMCMQAVDMLTNAIEKKDERKHTKVFKNELIVRGSTDKNSTIEFEN